LLYVGLLLTEYFIFVVFKDLFIMISQVFFGGFMGFWHGIILHIVTMPLDILVLLILSVWGTAVMTQEGTAKCMEDRDCQPFVSQARINIIIGYGYIFLSLFIKPVILISFCFCCNGLSWMNQDEQEEKDWNIRRVPGGRVIS